MSAKSRILIIGGSGYIGKYIAEASAKAGHPTFALLREATISNPSKSSLIQSFRNHGILMIQGDIYDNESLVEAIKQVDVVISVVGRGQVADQVKIIAAIKEAGNRFLPSEFGCDVDNAHPVEPAASMFAEKARIRRTIEAEGIPYTYISCYGFAGFFLSNLGQKNATAPPRDKVVIPGDGNNKGIFVVEEDIATYTIKAVDDPRTLNKTLHIRPPANILSFGEIVALWEEKIGKALEKNYVPEDEILKRIRDSPSLPSFILSIEHFVFVIGGGAMATIDQSSGVDACELYPEVKYTTVGDYLGQFA